jgi:hypothetical protein
MKCGVPGGCGESHCHSVSIGGDEDRAAFCIERVQSSRNCFSRSRVAELAQESGDRLGVIDSCAADLHATGKMAAMLLSFHKS